MSQTPSFNGSLGTFLNGQVRQRRDSKCGVASLFAGVSCLLAAKAVGMVPQCVPTGVTASQSLYSRFDRVKLLRENSFAINSRQCPSIERVIWSRFDSAPNQLSAPSSQLAQIEVQR